MCDRTTLDSFGRRRVSRAPLALGSALIICLVLAMGSALAESTCKVTITIKDENGAVQPGVQVVLTPTDTREEPITSRAVEKTVTNNKGVAFFPLVPYNAQGEGRYALSISKDGWFIREFKYDNRKSTREQVQASMTTSTKIPPNFKFPALQAFPGGEDKIDLVLAPLSSYAQHAAPAATSAGAAPETDAAPDPLMLAKALVSQEKYGEAETAIKALIEKDPKRADYEYELARLYHTQEAKGEEKGGEVRAALLRTLAKDPSFAGAHHMLGTQSYQGGHVEDGIKELEAELAAHPGDQKTRADLGTMYSGAGRKDDAIKAFEEVIAAEPKNAEVLVALGGLYAGKGDLKKSEDAFSKVAAIDPGKADQAFYKVGKAISDQKDLGDDERQRAVDAFKKAIELNPKNEKAHRDLGYTLLGLGKIDEAKSHFKTYLDLKPAAADAATIREFLKTL